MRADPRAWRQSPRFVALPFGKFLKRQVEKKCKLRSADREVLSQGNNVTYLVIKAAVSGVLVMLISEVARRSPGFGGLIASLPLVSVLAIIWLWRDTADIERIAAHAESTFWFVLPSLPMFLAFPAMLRHGVGFWLALSLSCALTMLLYAGALWLLPKVGITI